LLLIFLKHETLLHFTSHHKRDFKMFLFHLDDFLMPDDHNDIQFVPVEPPQPYNCPNSYIILPKKSRTLVFAAV
jgi:hypothetical protein